MYQRNVLGIELGRRKTSIVWVGVLVGLLAALSLICGAVSAAPVVGTDVTYTLDAEFDQGVLVNVNHDSPNNDQLQLNETVETLPFIWVAASARGTIVKIDTVTGTVLGEYWSSPSGRGKNPSRTTVDLNGNVWAGNRAENSGGKGSVVQVGLLEAGQCVDRNGNGVIDTSAGLGDIRPWTNAGGVDTNGGVATAADECIIKYVRVNGNYVRHVSVDGNNNVWAGGHFGGDNTFDLIDGSSGAILATFDKGCGGYGGLVDGNGVLWSSSRTPFGLLRYDTNGTITTSDDTWACPYVSNAYGLGIDSGGNIWHSQYGNNTIRKVSPAGVLLGTFGTGGAAGDRGVAVTASDDNVWVANSWGNNVSRLNSSGGIVAVITVGNTPTGVAVDAAGKVWATNLGSSTASRIDPATNTVDLTVSLGSGANPYNYSDMTGVVAFGTTSPQGTWTVVQDSGAAGTQWGVITWNTEPEASEPAGTSITVEAKSSDTEAGLGGAAYVPVSNGAAFSQTGRFIQVRATLRPNGQGASPVLSDIRIQASLEADLCPDLYRWSTSTSPSYKWDPFPTTFQGWNEVRFVNSGPGDALNVTATITCAPSNVTVLDGTVSLGNIPAGGTAWSIDDFALELDMTSPQDPSLGILWQVEYDDASGVHHVVQNVPKFCGEDPGRICPGP